MRGNGSYGDRRVGGRLTGHETVQHPRRLVADPLGRQRDARQGGVGEFAEDVVVFQAMLGYDAGLREVVDLIDRTRAPSCRR